MRRHTVEFFEILKTAGCSDTRIVIIVMAFLRKCKHIFVNRLKVFSPGCFVLYW